MIRFLVLHLFFLNCICEAQTKQNIDFAATNWTEAVGNAGRSGKQIFLYAKTKSCRFCRQMERQVFNNPKVTDYYNSNFVAYKIDIEDNGEGEALSKQYGIVGFPTYLYFDQAGKKLHQSSGFKPAEDFIQDGKNASNPDKALFSMLAKYEDGPKLPELLFNLSSALAYYQTNDSPYEKVTEEYLATQSSDQLESEKNLRFIFDKYLGFRSPATQYLLTNQQKFVPYFSKADVEKRVQRIITETASDAGRKNDSLLLNDIKQIVLTSFADTAKVLSVAQIYYYRGRQDWPKFAKATLDYGNGAGAADWQTMYETGAYLKYFAKDQGTLQMGVQIMDKVLKLHKNYEHLCIYARLQSKVGNKILALKAAREAKITAQKEGEDGEEASALIAELGAPKK